MDQLCGSRLISETLSHTNALLVTRRQAHLQPVYVKSAELFKLSLDVAQAAEGKDAFQVSRHAIRLRVWIEYLSYLLDSISPYSLAGGTIDGMGILLILKILKGTRWVDVGGSDSVEGHDVCLRVELPALRSCYTTLFVRQLIENSDKICFGDGMRHLIVFPSSF